MKGEPPYHCQHTESAAASCKSQYGETTASEALGRASFPAAVCKLDDTWKETESLGFDDLLTMAKLFDKAHTLIMHQQQDDAKAHKESERAAA